MKNTRLNGTAYFYIVLMAIMLVIIISSAMMESFASKLLPIVFSSIGLILAGIGLTQELRGKEEKTSDEEEPVGKEEMAGGRGNYLSHLVWAAGFATGIFVLGFMIAIPLFLFAYMKWLRAKWLVTVACAAVTTALVYGIFHIALQVDMYPGLLFAG